MVSASDILEFVDGIVQGFSPEQIILFGSYAYGQPNADSDVDLLVVMNHTGPWHRQATRIRLAVPVSFPLDLIVRSAPVIRRRIEFNDFFLKEVVEKGLVLHAANYARVGTEGRRRLRRRLAAAPLAQAKSP